MDKSDIRLTDRITFRREKKASVMVWARITSTKENTTVLLIQEGATVNQHVSVDLLKEKLVSWIKRHSEKLDILFSRIEPRSIQLIASSCVIGLRLGYSRVSYGLHLLQI